MNNECPVVIVDMVLNKYMYNYFLNSVCPVKKNKNKIKNKKNLCLRNFSFIVVYICDFFSTQ